MAKPKRPKAKPTGWSKTIEGLEYRKGRWKVYTNGRETRTVTGYITSYGGYDFGVAYEDGGSTVTHLKTGTRVVHVAAGVLSERTAQAIKSKTTELDERLKTPEAKEWYRRQLERAKEAGIKYTHGK